MIVCLVSIQNQYKTHLHALIMLQKITVTSFWSLFHIFKYLIEIDSVEILIKN